jgi:hypothetical protein
MAAHLQKFCGSPGVSSTAVVAHLQKFCGSPAVVSGTGNKGNKNEPANCYLEIPQPCGFAAKVTGNR